MTIHKKVSSFLARLALIGLLVTPTAAAVVLAPAPAYAQVPTTDKASLAATIEQTLREAWAAAKEIAVLGNILSGLQSLYSTVTDMFGKLFDKIDLQTAIRTASDRMRTQVDMKMHDDTNNVNWWLGRIKGLAEIASKDPINPAVLTQICRDARGKQASMNMELYQESRLASMLRGLDKYGRLVGDPIAQHAAAAANRVDAGSVSKSDTKKGNTKASRHADEEADLDMSATSIMPSVLREAYEEPAKIPLVVNGDQVKVDGETVMVYNYDDKNKNQRMFRYAFNYCYNLSGPENIPPLGAAATTPNGVTAWGGSYLPCASSRSMDRVPCFQAVIKLTRMNCNDKENAQNCKSSKELCELFKANNELPASFGDCSKPLSPYQHEYLENTKCLAGRRTALALSAGMRQADALAMSDTCQIAYSAWKTQLREESNTVMMAIRNLMQARASCK